MSHHLQRVGVREVFKPLDIDDPFRQVAEALEDLSMPSETVPTGTA